MSTDELSVDPRARNWVWRIIQLLMQSLFASWLRYRVEGVQHLPEGAALLLINHQSALDPMVVAVALKRPVSYLARHELFSIPGLGWLLQNTHVMPIHRQSAGAESIRRCVVRLQQGYYVGIFPEGTRSQDGRLGEIKPGFLSIVRRTDAPLIPVGVAGTGAACPRGSIFVWPRTVRVVVGQAIPQELVKELSRPGREQEFLDLVRQRMEQCIDDAERWRHRSPPQSARKVSLRPRFKLFRRA